MNDKTFKDWEKRAKEIIEESEKIYYSKPDLYPIGWKELAVTKLQHELKDVNIFASDYLETTRFSIANQLLDMVNFNSLKNQLEEK